MAGSERGHNTKNTGMRLQEGCNINRSLLALGSCINALVEASEKNIKIFIPWRNSKLTRILKESIGKNSRVSMIANLSPCINSLEENLNTLNYANRAKNLKLDIKQNLEIESNLNYDEDPEETIKKLQDELKILKQKIDVENQFEIPSKINNNTLYKYKYSRF